MFRFAHPELLWLLALVPLLLALFVWARWRSRKALATLGEGSLLARLMPERAPARPVWKATLSLLALSFFILGLAQPQTGRKLKKMKAEGIELIVALDVSRSMLAEDLKPNRLERARLALQSLIDQLGSDRLGMLVFAGEAYVQLPLTLDHGAAKLFLQSISTESVPSPGTALADAIELGMDSFGPEQDRPRALVIITDGEDHEGDAAEAAAAAREAGIVVHAIGLGRPNGTPIPVYGQGGQQDFLRDETGKVVMTKLDEGTLQQMASAGGGVYVRGSGADLGLSALVDELRAMDKAEFEAELFSEYEDHYQWFLGAGLLLLLLEFSLLERQNRLLARWNLLGKRSPLASAHTSPNAS